MSDPTDSTLRDIALRGKLSLSAVSNFLISRGLQDVAELSAKDLPALIDDVRAVLSDKDVSPDELAALVTKLTRAAIKNGFFEFAEYTAYVHGMIGGVDVRLSKIGGHIESSWRMLGQCKEFSHIDPTGNVGEILEQREREQCETLNRRLCHYHEQKQVKSELATLPTSTPSIQADDIHEAARNGDSIAISRILNVDPTRLDAKDHHEQTPLRLTVEGRHIDTAELLLSHRADVNAQDDLGTTALHAAAQNGHAAMFQLLVLHGAQVNRKDDFGATSLDYASFMNEGAIAEIIRQHGGMSGKAVR